MKGESDFPNLFVIGAAKSGTTTLHSGLLKHPDIYMSPIKEPRFFSEDELYSKGLNWYLPAHFKGARNYKIRGEASPTYLKFSQITVPRMKAFPEMAGAKFIAILRDPIKRAQSDYWQQVRLGHENQSFREALITQRRRPGSPTEYRNLQFEYFRGGQYAELLQPFLENFPPNRFHFVLHEDLKSNFQGTFDKIFHFLDVNANIQLPMEIKNPARLPRSRMIHQMLKVPLPYPKSMKRFLPVHLVQKLRTDLGELNMRKLEIPPIELPLQKELLDAYEGDISALEEILGRNLDIWRTLNKKGLD